MRSARGGGAGDDAELSISQPGAKAARPALGDGRLGRWFWETDKLLLILVVVLISIGLIAVAAASPAAATRYSGGGFSFAPLYYFYRQLIWTLVAVPVLIVVSMLSKPTARRLSILGAVLFTALLFLVPIIGEEVNGARRWLGMGIAQFQPSEFLKPLFIVSIAWLLSLKDKDPSLPIVPLSAVITGIIALLLMQQPNFGETIIFVAAWVLLLALSGASLRSSASSPPPPRRGGARHFFYPVATARIDGSCLPRRPITSWKSALRTLTAGGCSGGGPAPERANSRCEPHNDYIFSVIGEVRHSSLLAIAMLYRRSSRAADRLLHEEDKFLVLATAGVTQFGLQADHMAVTSIWRRPRA